VFHHVGLFHSAALRLREIEKLSLVRYGLLDNAATIFSHPSLNAIGFLGNLEDTSSPSHTIRAIATIACLSSVGEVYTLENAIEVVVVVVTAGDPLNSLLLFKCSKETSVD
jgi:hypothetical protein